MSIMPIPWRVMLDWAEYHELDHPETDLLVSVIRRVDAETMSRARAKQS